MSLDYEKDIAIDESALDVEWLQQPTLMFQYSAIEAEAQLEMDQAESDYQVIKAELDQEARNDPESFGLEGKITESALGAAIRSDERYADAHAAVNKARYNHAMAKAAVRALYGKKEALENLVKLHGQNYFAGPSVPRDLGGEWEAKQKSKRSNKTVKIRRKKKAKS